MAVFRIQPPPTGTLYSVLQKAKPGWSTKDLLKVYQKLQKVSITDGESLAKAVSEGSLNNILAEAGEKRLKTSTLQLLRLASRDPARKVNDVDEELPHFRVPMCPHASNDVLSMKLPSIRSLGPPPLMPSKRGDPRWKPKVMAALPRVKSEPILGKRRSPRNVLRSHESPGLKLVHPMAVSHVGIMPPDWSRKALAPALPTVPEMPERMPKEPPKELNGPIANGSAGHSGIASNSSSSFHSYGTFVEKQGQETFHHMEATYSSRSESYAMTFEGSSDPARSRDEFAGDEELTASEEPNFDEESLESESGTEGTEGTMEVAEDGFRDVLDANEATTLDITLPSPKKQLESRRSDKAVDHCQQVAAQRRQQQRRHIIRAYG